MASDPITLWQIDREKVETVTDFIFLGSRITVDGDCSHETERHLLLGRKAMTNLESILKSRHHFADKGQYSQSYSFSSSHVQMWQLDRKEGWALKNWCFDAFELWCWSPLDYKEIKAVNCRGDNPEYSLERLEGLFTVNVDEAKRGWSLKYSWYRRLIIITPN